MRIRYRARAPWLAVPQLAGVAVLARPAIAACDTGLAERMHAKLHPERPLDHERAVCEPWRGIPGRFIVAAAPAAPVAASQTVTEFDLDVLVVQQADNGNTERARSSAALFEPTRAFTEDAMRVDRASGSTPRAISCAESRVPSACASRAQASSRADPVFGTSRCRCTCRKGPQLAKVLDELRMVALERGEWDSDCVGRFETAARHVSIARGASQRPCRPPAAPDAHRKAESACRADECVTSEQPARFATRCTLRFDGTRYRVSAADPGP